MKLFTGNLIYIMTLISRVSTTSDVPNKQNLSELDENELISLVSKPFYIYTKTGLFGTADSNLKRDYIKKVIEYTEKYVSQSKAFDKNPNEILSCLCENITKGLKATGLDALMYEKVEEFFNFSFVYNPSQKVLDDYVDYCQGGTTKSSSFIQKLIDLIMFIPLFIIGLFSKSKDDEVTEEKEEEKSEEEKRAELLQITIIKQLCKIKRDIEKDINDQKNKDDGMDINGNVGLNLSKIAEILVGIEVRQVMIPEDSKIHNKLKNELGMLIAAIKLMNFDNLQLQTSIFKGLLHLDTNIKQFMVLLKVELEILKNSKASSDRQDFTIRFLKENKSGLYDDIVKNWFMEVYTNTHPKDKTAILGEYIEHLHQSLVYSDENAKN